MGKRKKKNTGTPAITKFGSGSTWNYGGPDFRSTSRVVIIDKDGKPLREYPTWGWASDYEAMCRRYESKVEGTGSDRVSTVYVPVEDEYTCTVDLGKKRKRPLMCTYDATKLYLESMLGIKLSADDAEFFEAHPLVQEDGVPFPDTLRVVQELVQPYGVGISRVRLAPNYGVQGDIKQWRKVLGVNPMALADRTTTNEEFAAQMNGKVDISQFRFEYGSEALFPSVSCGVMSGANTGATGGHATYVPPRRRASGMLLSFQLDRLERVQWKTPPVFTSLPLSLVKEVLAYDVEKWYKEQNKHTGSSYFSKPKQEGAKTTDVRKSETPVVVPAALQTQALPAPVVMEKGVTVVQGTYTYDYHGIVVMREGVPVCFRCHRGASERKHTQQVPGICDACWRLVCAQIGCIGKVCKSAGADAPLPDPPYEFVSLDWQQQRLYLRCMREKCYTVFYADRTHGPIIVGTIRSIKKYEVAQDQARQDALEERLRLYAKVRERTVVVPTDEQYTQGDAAPPSPLSPTKLLLSSGDGVDEVISSD